LRDSFKYCFIEKNKNKKKDNKSINKISEAEEKTESIIDIDQFKIESNLDINALLKEVNQEEAQKNLELKKKIIESPRPKPAKFDQFPLDFNEDDFIILNFNKISRSRRQSKDDDRLSETETTDISGNGSDANQLACTSDGNISDYESTKSKAFEEEKIYDPDRDSNDQIRGRTKQKIYVKYRRNADKNNDELSDDSDDDPIREMLKANIHKIYEQNEERLNINAAQYIELKRMQEIRQKLPPFNYDNYDYDSYNTYFNTQQIFTQMIHHMSKMVGFNMPPSRYNPNEPIHNFDPIVRSYPNQQNQQHNWYPNYNNQWN